MSPQRLQVAEITYKIHEPNCSRSSLVLALVSRRSDLAPDALCRALCS